MTSPGRLLLGVILVVAGVLFLLDLSDFVNASETIRNWWPVAVIALGLLSLLGPSRSVIGGSIVTIFGAVLLLATLDILQVSAGELILPLILIAVGVGLLLVRSSRRAERDPHSTVNGFAVFGGQEIVSRAGDFKGGSLTALFGGMTLDLRNASIDSGGASVDTFVAFGSIEVIVPHGWRVTVSGIPIFGAFEDKIDSSTEPDVDAPNVRIGGLVLFGAVEVKNRKD